MGDNSEARECSKCGRRYMAPEVVEAGRCPRCGGELVPLDEPGEPDQRGSDY